MFNYVHFVRNWKFSRNKFWDDLALIHLLVDLDFNPPRTHKIRRYVYEQCQSAATGCLHVLVSEKQVYHEP